MMDGGDEVNPQVVPAWAAIPWSCTPLSMSSPLSCDLSCSLSLQKMATLAV